MSFEKHKIMNSDTEYEEKIDKILLVACFMCERTGRVAWMNAKDSYPCDLIINQNLGLPNGIKTVPTTVPAYLCAEHYKEYNK